MFFRNLSYQERDIIEIAVVIVIVFLAGILVLLQRNRVDPERWKRQEYSPQRAITAIGLFLIGLALSLVPTLIAVILNQMVLTVFTIILFLAESIILKVIERKGFLKASDVDNA